MKWCKWKTFFSHKVRAWEWARWLRWALVFVTSLVSDFQFLHLSNHPSKDFKLVHVFCLPMHIFQPYYLCYFPILVWFTCISVCWVCSKGQAVAVSLACLPVVCEIDVLSFAVRPPICSLSLSGNRSKGHHLLKYASSWWWQQAWSLCYHWYLTTVKSAYTWPCTLLCPATVSPTVHKLWLHFVIEINIIFNLRSLYTLRNVLMKFRAVQRPSRNSGFMMKVVCD